MYCVHVFDGHGDAEGVSRDPSGFLGLLVILCSNPIFEFWPNHLSSCNRLGQFAKSFQASPFGFAVPLRPGRARSSILLQGCTSPPSLPLSHHHLVPSRPMSSSIYPTDHLRNLRHCCLLKWTHERSYAPFTSTFYNNKTVSATYYVEHMKLALKKFKAPYLSGFPPGLDCHHPHEGQ